MITIDEQIADEIDAFELHRQIHCRVDLMMAAKIASLERLKRIDAERQWVGLTDEEIEKLLDGMSLGCCARDVMVVQEKLKEKNT